MLSMPSNQTMIRAKLKPTSALDRSPWSNEHSDRHSDWQSQRRAPGLKKCKLPQKLPHSIAGLAAWICVKDRESTTALERRASALTLAEWEYTSAKGINDDQRIFELSGQQQRSPLAKKWPAHAKSTIHFEICICTSRTLGSSFSDVVLSRHCPGVDSMKSAHSTWRNQLLQWPSHKISKSIKSITALRIRRSGLLSGMALNSSATCEDRSVSRARARDLTDSVHHDEPAEWHERRLARRNVQCKSRNRALTPRILAKQPLHQTHEAHLKLADA